MVAEPDDDGAVHVTDEPEPLMLPLLHDQTKDPPPAPPEALKLTVPLTLAEADVGLMDTVGWAILVMPTPALAVFDWL
jgi:hypothetical protein